MAKNTLISSVCAAALAAGLATSAVAADEGNWYAGIEGAYSLLGKEKSRSTATGGLETRQNFNDGWAAGLVGGYDYGNIRLEGELGYHRHTLDAVRVFNDGGLGLPNGAGDGKSTLKTLMMNMVYDFGDREAKVRPFVGGGLGIGDMDWSDLRAGGVDYLSSSDTVFAYQAFAGVRTRVSEAVELMAKYRYLGTSDARFTAVSGDSLRADYDVHDFVVGLTYRFGGSKKTAASEMPQPVVNFVEPEPVAEPEPAPVLAMEEPTPPEPMPEPAAAPAIDKGPYVVYFGLDRTDLDQEARVTVENAADAAELLRNRDGQAVIAVSGYADRSGTAIYNARIAEQRAERVKAALEARGVAADQIVVEGHGERDNAVLTEDGVAEARNRRVTILLK